MPDPARVSALMVATPPEAYRVPSSTAPMVPDVTPVASNWACVPL